jgi:hypothetical protein
MLIDQKRVEKWATSGWVIIGLAALLMSVGCQSRAGLADSTQCQPIWFSGCGLGGQGGFKQGFVLRTRGVNDYTVAIVEGDQLKSLGRSQFMGRQKRLTAEEKEKIQGYLSRVEGYWGCIYTGSQICGGSEMILFESPDAAGNPVLGSSRAAILSLEGLSGYLKALAQGPESQEMVMDAATGEARKRAMKWRL